jgi:hypothetical protein
MNLYCTPTEAKTIMGLTKDTDDALLLALCERLSRVVDRVTRRFFYERTETRSFDHESSLRLGLDADLLSVTTFTSDGSRLTEGTDYRLWPVNESPKRIAEILFGSGSVFSWSTTPQSSVTIAGLWGFHDEPDYRWEATGDTVLDERLSASATALTVDDGTAFQVGQTLKAGTEQVYVSAISTNTLTITRGVNGTTAAEHVAATALTVYRPIPEIRTATRLLVEQVYKMKDSAPWGRVEFVDVGVVQTIAGVPEIISGMLAPLRRLDV